MTDSAAIQAIHDGATGPTTIPLQPRQYFTEPVQIWKDFVTVKGLGRYESTVTTSGAFPAFIVGVQPGANDGISIDDSNRPAGSGVYDSSVVGYGFATKGRQIGVGLASQFTLGKWGAKGWGYQADLPLTWRFMFEYKGQAPLPQGLPLFGSGDYAASKPHPLITFLSADHPGLMGVEFCIQGDPTNRVFYVDIGGLSGVKECSITLTAAGWSAEVNGAAAVLLWGNPAQANTAGKGLEPQFLDAPFQIGNTGFPVGTCPTNAATDLAFWGLWCGSTSSPRPASHLDRYFKIGPETIAFIDFRQKAPGRFLTTFEGDRLSIGGGSSQGRLLISDAQQDNTRQTTGTTLEGFTIDNSGVLIHRAFTTRIRDVGAVYGRQGLATTKHVNSYPLDVTDCEFGGSDAAVSLYSTIGSMERVILRGGGNVVVRSSGTQIRWTSVLVTGFGQGGGRYVLAHLPDDDGCIDSYQHILIDNEGPGAFSEGVVYIENGSRYPCRISVDHLAVVPATGLPVYVLKGGAGQSVARLCHTMETFGAEVVGLDGKPADPIVVQGPADRWDINREREMSNQYADFPRWALINGDLGFSLDHVNDWDLTATAVNPATKVSESCVRITFDVCEESPVGPGIITARTACYFGDDAAALRKWIPTLCAAVNK